METIKNKQKAIAGLNELFEYFDNGTTIAQIFDDLIFEYMQMYLTSGIDANEHVSYSIFFMKEMRNFFKELEAE